MQLWRSQAIKYVYCYRQDLPQAALLVLFLLTADFWVFRPAGATRCPDQGEILHGGADIGSLLHAKFHLDRSRGGVYGPKNWKEIGILPI